MLIDLFNNISDPTLRGIIISSFSMIIGVTAGYVIKDAPKNLLNGLKRLLLVSYEFDTTTSAGYRLSKLTSSVLYEYRVPWLTRRIGPKEIRGENGNGTGFSYGNNITKYGKAFISLHVSLNIGRY